jgi:hypothetical protein
MLLQPLMPSSLFSEHVYGKRYILDFYWSTRFKKVVVGIEAQGINGGTHVTVAG